LGAASLANDGASFLAVLCWLKMAMKLLPRTGLDNGGGKPQPSTQPRSGGCDAAHRIRLPTRGCGGFGRPYAKMAAMVAATDVPGRVARPVRVRRGRRDPEAAPRGAARVAQGPPLAASGGTARRSDPTGIHSRSDSSTSPSNGRL